ncbi:RNA/RNP complex-1-interacting phosphatase-like protein [Aphelenchoides besseyi]|nr:RNA/RNP complex-1-interacting phosphatase-like protein [Aphelenchoides besseyi]
MIIECCKRISLHLDICVPEGGRPQVSIEIFRAPPHNRAHRQFYNPNISTPTIFKPVLMKRNIAIKYEDLSPAKKARHIDEMIDLFNKTLDECRLNKGALLPDILRKCNFDCCQITHVVLNATNSLVTVFDTYEVKCKDIFASALPRCVEIFTTKLPTTFKSIGILTVPVVTRFGNSNTEMNQTLLEVLIELRKGSTCAPNLRLLLFEESCEPDAVERGFTSLPRLLHQFFSYDKDILAVKVKRFTMSNDDVGKPVDCGRDVNSNRDDERGYRQRRRKYNRFDLPDRWSDYSAIGKVIPDARIIAFKTPLKSDFYETNNADRFEVTDLLEKIKEFGGELGLVVDLTYTSKYYDPEQFTSHGISHKKIFCHGRDFEKLATSGNEFVDVLKDFFKENSNNNKWVGVHCTHGINRTGYLICRYLTESLGWSFEKALKEFEEARGYPIERTEYLETLRKLADLTTE